jgi:hypothetical protein
MKTLKKKFSIYRIFLSMDGHFFEIAGAQETGQAPRPDPREIPLPRIITSIGTLPGIRELPIRKEMPDVLVMNNGKKVAGQKKWKNGGKK